MPKNSLAWVADHQHYFTLQVHSRVLHYLLMHTQPLFRVSRTVLSSQLVVAAFIGFYVWIRSAALQVTALITGSQAKVMCQL